MERNIRNRFRERLREAGLDTRVIGKYFNSSEKLYVHILRVFCRTCDTMARDIVSCAEADDLIYLRIHTNGMKSAMLAIGATALAEKAEHLEFAAKSEERGYILAYCGEFVERLRKMGSEVAEIVGCEE